MRSEVLRLAVISTLLLAAAPHADAASDTSGTGRSSRIGTKASKAEKNENDAKASQPAGQLTRAPELLQFVEAPYPAQAEKDRITGSVGLIVDIDDKGAVTKVELKEPAGNGFDEAAMEAVRKFKFNPAEIDGKPAAVRVEYKYNFVLKPETPANPAATENARAKQVNLRGKLLQRGNREPVANATISVDDGAFDTYSDSQGRFEFAGVPSGKHKVVAVASNFSRFETEEEILEGNATEVTYYIQKLQYSPYETVVRGKRERKEVARVELKQEEIRLVAGTGGDAFKVIQNLPGVSRAPYGFGVLVVRGGRPQDTRVYVDGVWIPLIFHFGGLTAVFNSDLLSDLTFLPGNMSSRDGRGIAGVVEAESRSPSKQGYHGYFNISLLDSTALLEGPVNEDWSVAAAGRVSYVDLILSEALPSSVQFMSAPRYWDYQAKAEYAPKGSRNSVRIMAFGAHDSMKLLLTNAAAVDPEGRNDFGMAQGFHRLLGSWTRTLSANTQNRLTVALGNDTASTTLGADIKGDVSINALQMRNSFTHQLSDSASLELGIDSYLGWFNSDVASPPPPLPGETPDPILSRQIVHNKQKGTLFEPGAWVEATLKPWKGVRIIPGLRFDYESTLKFFTFDPRIALFQQIDEETILKGAIGRYQQAPDYRFGQWTAQFGNPDLGPEKSVHAMLGTERKLTDSINIDVQIYYKWLNNLVYQSARTIEKDGQEVLERWANVGDGRAYGLEILLRHELTQNFFGWISYSLSRSERRSTLWTDTSYRPSMFDQPHHLVVVATYKWPNNWVTGMRFQYASGNLGTPFNSAIYDSDADMYSPIPGTTNSVRGPAFVSLDLRVDKRIVFKQWTINAFLDVQNVTNNTNGEFLMYNYDFSKSTYVRGLPIFPTLGVKAEF